jgi:2-polyprenyl-3-methyl-5-hydroxy-6-metoxy-1,4-benzoquinol methylase
MGWWRWEAFDPGAFYDRDYFQSAAAAKGYSDYAALEPGVRRTSRARLRRISGLLAHRSKPDRNEWIIARNTVSEREPSAPRLLDLGCGTGVFLDEARSAGFDVEGVEVSAYAADQARARGLVVHGAPLDTIDFASADFDVVTLWDVIEHVPDPMATLEQAAAALRRGGVLALSTGDVTSLCARLSGAHWHLFTLPEHLCFFSPRALRSMLRACGLRVARETREVNWVPVGYILERLTKSLLGRHLRLPHLPLSGLVLPATLGDVMGIYAVKPEGV